MQSGSVDGVGGSVGFGVGFGVGYILHGAGLSSQLNPFAIILPEQQ